MEIEQRASLQILLVANADDGSSIASLLRNADARPLHAPDWCDDLQIHHRSIEDAPSISPADFAPAALICCFENGPNEAAQRWIKWASANALPIIALLDNLRSPAQFLSPCSDVLPRDELSGALLWRSLLLALCGTLNGSAASPPSQSAVAHPNRQSSIINRQSNGVAFDQVFRAHPVAMWLIDPETAVVVDANEAALRFYGYSYDEMCGRDLAHINLAAPSEMCAALQATVDGKRSDWEFRHRTADGRVRDVAISSAPVTAQTRNGEKLLLFSLVQDVTAQKLADARQERMSQGLRAVLAAADELLKFQDFDAMLRRAVELGRERLGLERCSLFLLDESGESLSGTWSVGRHGVVVDERQWCVQPIQQWLHDSTPTDSRRWVTTERELKEWDGERAVSLGRRGWVADTLIRSEAGIVGTWHNDTAWSGAAPDPIQQELVAVYGSLLGNIIERKRAEKKLRHSELLFRLLAENATDLIARVAPQGTILYASPSCRAMLGYAPAELIGHSIYELIDPDQAGEEERFHQDYALLPDAYMRTARVRRKDGHWVWLETITRPIRDRESGLIREFQLASRDITERRAAESALRDSEERFRVFMDNTPAMTFIKDEDGRYVYFNRTTQNLVGSSLEELRGKTNFDRFAPEVAQQLRENDLAVLSSGQAREFLEVLPVPGGRAHFWLTFKFPLHQADGRRLIGGVAVDVTERHEFESALKQSEHRLRTVIDSAPIVIWAIDAEGIFTFSEGQGLETLGLQGGEAVGQSVFELFGQWPDVAADIKRALAGETFTSDVGLGAISYEVRHAPLRDGDGEIIGVIGVSTDVTTRRRDEEKLRHYAQRLENLLEVDHAIRSAHSAREVADVALGRLCRQLEADRAAVTVFNFESDEATVLATRGEVPLQAGQHIALSDIAPRAASNDEEHELVFWQRDPLAQSEAAHTRSIALIAQGELVGALDLRTSDGRPIDDEKWIVAREVAGQLAIAIQQARLFDQVETGREQLQVLSRRLIEAQEAERRHIARELHDEIGQVLTAVKLNLQGIERLDHSAADASETLGARVKGSIEIVEHALGQVRDLSLNLRPSLLDDLGLTAAMRWFIDRLNGRSDLVVRLHIETVRARFEAGIETACFRVMQEAITNVERHAEASSIEVRLVEDDGHLQLKVADNGHGFDVREARERAASDSSLGLPGMEERVGLTGGRLSIESSPRGTIVRAIFEIAADDETTK